jgi:hypothetical protein
MLFSSAHPRLGDVFTLRLGFLAPISLALVPIWAFHDRDYTSVVATLLLNIAFVLLVAFSIVNTRKWIGGVSLFIFNIIGTVSVLGGLM